MDVISMYGMIINRVKMSGDWKVPSKTDISNVFLNTGLSSKELSSPRHFDSDNGHSIQDLRAQII